VVFVELPDVGQVLEKGDTFGSIESVKAASDLYMPISGEVVAVNQQLVAEPELVNSSPFEDGWMIEVLLSTPNEVEHLMEATAYQRFVAELS
jgi:glycine cleavage system H protein